MSSLKTEMFLTLFYGVVDASAGKLVYADMTGHPQAFVVRGDGQPCRLEATRPPLGLGVGNAKDAEVSWVETSGYALLVHGRHFGCHVSAHRPLR